MNKELSGRVVQFLIQPKPSDSGDEIGNHWDQLMGNRWESANLENMVKRKVKINNSFTHYDTPDGHLRINDGDIIANKCIVYYYQFLSKECN